MKQYDQYYLKTFKTITNYTWLYDYSLNGIDQGNQTLTSQVVTHPDPIKIWASAIAQQNATTLESYGGMPSSGNFENTSFDGQPTGYGMLYGDAGLSGQNSVVQSQINQSTPATGAYCHWGACHPTSHGMAMGAPSLSVGDPLEAIHDILFVAGMIPVLGIAPDLVNTGIYVLQGDYKNAAFAGAAAIPVVGILSPIVKFSKVARFIPKSTKAGKAWKKVKGLFGKGSKGTDKGLATRGYKPKPGERTYEGFVKNNVPVDKETKLHTNSPGFNTSPKNANGQFKRFGTDSHGGLSPHVHQPTRNVNPKRVKFLADKGGKLVTEV